MVEAEKKTLIIPLSRDEVVRRIKRFRDGLGMSRREFGEIHQIRQRADSVGIFTSKQTMIIPLALWEDLGERGEEAMANHKITA